MAEVTDAVNGTESAGSGGSSGSGGSGSRTNLRKDETGGLATSDPLTKDRPGRGSKDEPPPFDADAT
jgi:sec-independent protein translocase protein TatB